MSHRAVALCLFSLAAAPTARAGPETQDRSLGMKEHQKGQELAERLGLFWIDNETGRPKRAYDSIAVKGYSLRNGSSTVALGRRIRARDEDQRLLLEAQWLQGFRGTPAQARRAAYELGQARLRKTPKAGYDRVVVVLDALEPNGSPQVLVVDQVRGVGKLDPAIVRKRLQRVLDGRGSPDRGVLALGVATAGGYAMLVDPPAGTSPGRVEKLITSGGNRLPSGAGFHVEGKTPKDRRALTDTLGALLGQDPKTWLEAKRKGAKKEATKAPSEGKKPTPAKQSRGLSGNMPGF